MNIVIDAGVILKGYFPDERGHEEAQLIIREYAEGFIELYAPHLILYEIVNALVVARNLGRLEQRQINNIITEIREIEINRYDVADILGLFDMSLKYGRTAYDASYLLLSDELKFNFVTGDIKLYNSVKNKLPWVIWIEDYRKIKPRAD